MKRFLDKTWAKVAAFILFFVFLGLSIAGSVGIYFLAANDVYLAGSEASRQILYDGQASDVMTTVIDGLYNCSDKDALRDWLLERCPPENGYGITVTNTATGEEFSTALPKDAKIIYTAHRRTVFSGTELNVTIELQEGFIPRTYEYRLSLWLMDIKDIIIPLTVLFVVLALFCCNRFGWGWDNFVAEANTGRGLKVRPWMKPIFKCFVPGAILFIYIYGMVTFHWR